MNKRDRIKTVIEKLITNPHFNKFSKPDIQKAIIIAREALDERTVERYWNLLWNLQIIIQPELNTYSLNIVKIQEYELPLPLTADPKQQRLPL